MSARNPHPDYYEGWDAPPGRAEAVTPNDSTDLDFVAQGLYVGGAGNVVVTMLDGNDATFFAVPVGTTLRIRFTRVKATSTTATHLLALV